MPDRTAVRRRGAPEKRVQGAIRRALSVLGFQVHDLTQPRATMLPIGLPDLYARHTGWRVRLWIEVKAGRRQPTPAQAAWIADEIAAGGHAIVARSVDDVLRALREMGAPIDL